MPWTSCSPATRWRIAKPGERFVGAYDAKHNVIIEGEKAFLVVGADDFPLPIPLTRQDGGLEIRYGRRPA